MLLPTALIKVRNLSFQIQETDVYVLILKPCNFDQFFANFTLAALISSNLLLRLLRSALPREMTDLQVLAMLNSLPLRQLKRYVSVLIFLFLLSGLFLNPFCKSTHGEAELRSKQI